MTAAGAGEGGWVPTFSCVASFEIADLGGHADEGTISLVPFHGFSSVMKSLFVMFPTPTPHLDLTHSFPLLEDLTFPARARHVNVLGGNF